MAFAFNTNVLLPTLSDKVGKIWISVKDALLASGRWQLIGSGDGKAAFQLRGQTAGVAGSFDVFTKSPQWALGGGNFNAWPNSISNTSAWFVLEEIASGRVYVVQRTTSSSAETSNVWAGNAVATTGASATAPPAMVGPYAVLGTSMYLSTGSEMSYSSTTEQWLQIGAENAVLPGNVSPWFFAIWNKTNNTRGGGAFWLPLVDLEPGVTNNILAGAGAWVNVFGTPGLGDGGLAGTGATWRGGNAWAVSSISHLTCSGVGSSPPLYQQLGTDNKWRTQRPFIVHPTVGNRHVGKVDLVYLNKVSRDYPSTYDLAGAQPRLSLGHLLFPWTNIAPLTSP